MKPSDAPFDEHNSSTNCCDRYWARGYANSEFASWPSNARLIVLPPPHVSVTLASPIKLAARAKKEGPILSSPSQVDGEIASQPAAITSVKAVFPDPRAPTIATNPGLRGMFGVSAQGACVMSTCDMTCDGIACRGGSAPTYARPAGSMQA